jgi:hypothetical protein
MTVRRVFLFTLIAIASWFGGTSLWQPETRPFTTFLSAAAAVLFVLTLVSRFDPRLPPRRAAAPGSRHAMGKRVFFGSVALMAALIVLAPWHSRADFDVVGVLSIMQNALPFTVLCALFVAAVAGAGMWRRG